LGKPKEKPQTRRKDLQIIFLGKDMHLKNVKNTYIPIIGDKEPNFKDGQDI